MDREGIKEGGREGRGEGREREESVEISKRGEGGQRRESGKRVREGAEHIGEEHQAAMHVRR